MSSNQRRPSPSPDTAESEVTPARRDEMLREALLQGAALVPQPPARPAESLMRAIAAEARPGAWRASLVLLCAQWPVVSRERLIPALAVFTAVVFGAAAPLMSSYDLLVLTGALPVAAGLLVLLLSGPRVDPAHAVVSTTRTPFGALVMARTAVALGVLVAMGLVGSLALAVFGDRTLLGLVVAWLGPTVVIAALATLLAQLWRPIVGVTAALTGWAAVILLIALEMAGALAPHVSLGSLLTPGTALVAAEAFVAAVLLAAAWSIGVRVQADAVSA